MVACRKEDDAQVCEVVRWGGRGFPAFVAGRGEKKWRQI
jgi:hypothetical protein